MTTPEPRRPLFSGRELLGAAAALVCGAVVLVLSLARGEPQRQTTFDVAGKRPTVTATELAQWGVEGRRDYVVVDLRPAGDFAEGHIRGAVSCGTCHATVAEGRRALEAETFVDLTKKLVLYAADGHSSMKLPRFLASNPRVHLLAGGYAAWEAQVMARVAFGGETDEGQVAEKQRREAIRAFYAGERPASGKAATLPMAPIKRQGPHTPAKAAEGC